MTDVRIIVRTADRTRKAEVTVPRSNTGADVIQAAVDNWKLPVDTDYTLVNTSMSQNIQPQQALSSGAVLDGHILEVQPVLVAG